MAQIPYSPMGKRDPLAGDAEIEAMHRKLANRVKSQTVSPSIEHEMWLAKRMGEHGAEIFTGDTDPILRKERFRKAIKEGGLAAVVVGRGKDGKPENYEQCFARLFREPL